MKKILYIPLLFLFSNLHAQQGVVFKVKYLPNHTYTGIINMDINCTATLSGNDTIISKLATQGITQPLAANIKLKMGSNTQTGAVAADSSFPLTIKYNFDDLSVKINGNSIPIPTEKLSAGVAINGHVSKDGKIKADSIGGKKVTDSTEAKANKMMDAIRKNIQFPDHPMKIGETFTQNMPLNIPIGGNNMDFDSKVVYKLVSEADGNANFDVEQSMNITIPIGGAPMNINGTGTGKLVYNISKNFATGYTTNLIIKISGKIKTLQVDGTASVNVGYKYDIN